MFDLDLKFYISIFFRRLPLMLLIMLPVASAGIWFAIKLPPVYRSEASILVESPQIPIELAASTVTITSGEVIQIIQQKLMTRRNLQEIAEKFEVFKGRTDLSPAEKIEHMLESIHFRVLNLSAGSPRGTPSVTAFTIAFTGDDANLVARVTNELVTLILDQNVKLRTERATLTTNFFDQEVKRLSADLALLEGQIVKFKNTNSGSLPDSLDFRRNEISRVQGRLIQLEAQEVELREQRSQLLIAIENPGARTTIPEREKTDDERELSILKRQLIQKQSVFSDTHPQIITLKRQIDTLEALITGAPKQPQGEFVEDTGPAPLTQLEVSLKQINSNLSFLEDQRRILETRFAEIEATVSETPNVEMALNILVREHQAVQTQYSSALVALSAAATGETIEVRQQGERFEVIEPPQVPEKPQSPNRKLIAAGGVAGGAFLGFAMVVLLELMNKTIRRPIELTKTLGIQPLATIPYIRTRGEQVRSRMKMVVAGVLLFVALPLGGMWVQANQEVIELSVTKFLDQIGLNAISRPFG